MSITNHTIKFTNRRLLLVRKLPMILTGIFVAGSYLILVIFNETEEIKTLSVVFCSIMLEAAPFMLIGSLIGGVIEAFVSREKLMAFIPRGRVLPVLVAAGLGILLPVCECAIVPVVRRLCRKGLPGSSAIAYLLGGPAVNVIVFSSTALAYQFDWRIALLRVGLGYLIAVVVALLVQRLMQGRDLLIEEDESKAHHAGCSVGHAHGTEERTEHTHHSSSCSCGHEHAAEKSSFTVKLGLCINHASEDFITAGHYLVVGAFIASFAQTFVSRQFFTSFSEFTVLPTLMMICLAILLNLCSETDAFIVASMRGLIPLSAQLAFMLTGPIFDLKLLLMYQKIFSKRTIILLVASILITVFCVCAGIEIIEGYVQ